MSDELRQYIEFLGRWENPVYYSIFLILLIILLLYLMNKYVLIPRSIKHQEEKKEMERKYIDQMALFSQLDPDPLIRINPTGEIIFFNNAAKNLPGIEENLNIRDFISEINEIDLDGLIKENRLENFPFQINDYHFSILISGNNNFNFAHLYFRDITKRKQLEQRLKLLSRSLQEKLEDERQRIARELHDGIGQELLLTKVMLQKLDNKLKDGNNESELEKINAQMDEIVEELRNTIYQLKPKILEEAGLEPALTSLANSIQAVSSIKPVIDLQPLNGLLNKEQELYLYRVVQEALNNIVKHSQATEFRIVLTKSNNNIVLIISDNGTGFEVENVIENNNSKGIGLFSIKERTENFGGRFKVESSSENGTVIFLEIPIKNLNKTADGL